MSRGNSERGWLLDWIDRKMDHGYRLNYRKSYRYMDESHYKWNYGKKLANPGKIWGIRYDLKANKWDFYSDGVLLFSDTANKIPSDGKICFFCC